MINYAVLNRIGVECIPVPVPPWMPQTKAKVEEVTLNQDSHISRVKLIFRLARELKN